MVRFKRRPLKPFASGGATRLGTYRLCCPSKRANGFIDPYLIRFDQHSTDFVDTGFGIYRISGTNGTRPLKVQPLYEVTPFAQIAPSALPVGVAAGMAS